MAVDKQSLDIPTVVRLAGNEVASGRKLLAQSGLPLIRANTLDEAAQRVVMAIKATANTAK